MSFDLFVQSCIVLKRMTDVFKRYDDDRDGYITLSFEEFLTGEFFDNVELSRRPYVKARHADNQPKCQRFYVNDDQISVLNPSNLIFTKRKSFPSRGFLFFL